MPISIALIFQREIIFIDFKRLSIFPGIMSSTVILSLTNALLSIYSRPSIVNENKQNIIYWFGMEELGEVHNLPF